MLYTICYCDAVHVFSIARCCYLIAVMYTAAHTELTTAAGTTTLHNCTYVCAVYNTGDAEAFDHDLGALPATLKTLHIREDWEAHTSHTR
jgi:hypothetical protein